MRLWLVGLAFVAEVFAQSVSLPKGWKTLSRDGVLIALDAGNYPFMVRRLIMHRVDHAFALLSTGRQEEVLWEVEQKLAATQGREPLSFLIWGQDAKPHCDRLLIDGKSYQIIAFSPLLLAVSFSQDRDLSIAHVYVRLAENARFRVDVLPENMRLADTGPRLEVLAPRDPGKIADKIVSRARWSAAFLRMAGALQTTRSVTQSTVTTTGHDSGMFTLRDQLTGRQVQGTYSGRSSDTSYSSTSTVSPDHQARAIAESQAQVVETMAARRAADVNGVALRANTLLPGAEVFGSVYFKRNKDVKFSALTIPIGTFQFEFGVEWK